MLMGILIGIIVLSVALVFLGQRGTRLPWVPGRERRQRQLDADVNRGIEKRDTTVEHARDIDGSGFSGTF